ncbi:MAG: hypothetical protein ACXV0U_01525 [Kineosporiaceae bacterium]
MADAVADAVVDGVVDAVVDAVVEGLVDAVVDAVVVMVRPPLRLRTAMLAPGTRRARRGDDHEISCRPSLAVRARAWPGPR